MKIMARLGLGLGLCLAASLAVPATAAAQEFPPDDDWGPLRCGEEPMSDLYQDEAGAIDGRDIVGDAEAPAGLLAIDEDFLYLRLRLDADPTDGAGELEPFNWGMAFDLDDDLATYELLVLASGADQTVQLSTNETTTLPDDPADPADEPPVVTYPFADNGRSVVAADSTFGDDEDRFLDLAMPWTDLEPVGLLPLTRVAVWAATSSTDGALDADLACHDGGGGAPSLSDSASDETSADPDGDGDGDGSGEGRLEGGGGCASGGGAGWLAAMLIALAMAAGHDRRRSRT